MKIRAGFIKRDVGGRAMVVATGELSKEFKAMITLNETGKFIWELLEKETTKEEIVNKLLEACVDAERAQVEIDVEKFLNKLKEDNILE